MLTPDARSAVIDERSRRLRPACFPEKGRRSAGMAAESNI